MEKCAVFIDWNTQDGKNVHPREINIQPQWLDYFSEVYFPLLPQFKDFLLLLREAHRPAVPMEAAGVGRARFPWAYPAVKMHSFLPDALLFPTMLWGINCSKTHSIKFCLKEQFLRSAFDTFFFPKKTPFSCFFFSLLKVYLMFQLV